MTLCRGAFRCSTASSRLAAYEVLVMLADSSLSNLRLITKELMSMHHQSDPSLCKEFDVSLRRSSPSMICAALMGKTKRVKLCVSVCVSLSTSPPWRAGPSQALWG